VVPETFAVQLAPPFVVARMAPPAPTAHPRASSLKATALSFAVLPEVCVIQPPAPAPKAPAGSARARLSRVSAGTKSL